MSKKQLEEIESKINWLELRPSQIVIISQLIDYAKEQAERIQELEETNIALLESLRFQDEDLERENKRYREAISFANDELNEVLHANKTLDVKKNLYRKY